MSIAVAEPTMTDLYRRLPQPFFSVIGGQLSVEGVALTAIADQVGTPFYAYSAGRLAERAGALKGALAGIDPNGEIAIHFAAKANGNKAVLALFAKLGLGADIVSGGEMARALAAGVPANRIVFSGVGKTAGEIAKALTAGIHQINVESFEELRLVDRIAAGLGITADVALRVNPDVDAGTHTKISTGRREDKFGIDADRLAGLDNELKSLANVQIVGLACHIGSQILTTEPLKAAYARLGELADMLRARGLPITRLDLGGGFGVAYREGAGLGFDAVASAIRETVAGRGYALAIEPGRALVADAGVLVASTAFVKDGGAVRFLVLDAAMNDLVRPAMYDAHHDVVPVRAPDPAARRFSYDVVGPICESSDTFSRHVVLPEMAAGDLVALATAGAYGATMSSFYNGRALIPEVLVSGDRFAVVRKRVSIEDQLGWEVVPEFMHD
jgi:diaminopimelate decarboxylase